MKTKSPYPGNWREVDYSYWAKGKKPDNSCGSCLGGSQMMLGVYYSCDVCKGKGTCKHPKFVDPVFEGKRWNREGTSEIPATRITRCSRCRVKRTECFDAAFEVAIVVHNSDQWV